MLDAVIISDTHLGSENCQARQLVHFLDSVHDGDLRTHRLILNGDVFDSIDFRRLKKNHWRVLSLLRKLSDKIEIVWLNGNHDGPSEIVSHLLGVSVTDEYVLESGGRRFLVLHGHVFDSFIDSHPVLTWIGDTIYHFLQRIDSTHSFAKFAKRKSKTFLRCAQQIRDRSVEYARKRGLDAAVCGHTHQTRVEADGDVHYYNSGCWTELPCSYLTVQAGRVELHHYMPVVTDDEPVTVTPAPATAVPA